MTENEIIKILEAEKAYMDSHAGRSQSEALAYAIEAVKEIQQYRAIGTVEDWQKLIKKEATERRKLEEYFMFGSVEEFQALKEKSVAKTPTPIDYEKYMDVVENAKFLRGAYWCPNCNHTVRSGAYCNDCGQKLDWGE